MKFKCIKDFWMHRESADNGNTPAFKKAETYLFVAGRVGQNEAVCPCDNHGSVHYMDLDNEFYEYFVEVE